MRLYKSDSLDKTACDLGGDVCSLRDYRTPFKRTSQKRFLCVLFTVVFADNTRFCYMLILAR